MHYLIFFLSLSFSAHSLVVDVDKRDTSQKDLYVKGQVLVKIDTNHALLAPSHIEREIEAKKIRDFAFIEGLGLYRFDPNLDVMEVIKDLSSKEYVIYAEPDYIYHVAENVHEQNDPEFPRQWALENKSQSGGKTDADINAELMWTHHRGSRNVVVGIIDTGVDYTHPDLVDNMWKNPGEIPNNNTDDDANGFVDDVYGINTIRNHGNPLDDNGHGTHVAGTVGATGNNQLGVVGVAQSVQIAACKFLSAAGSGSLSDALECMEYFAELKSRVENPVNLVTTNNSWGGGRSSQAMLDAIKAHEQQGVLFVAAAGNENSNNDNTDSFPANYNVSNVISVAATDHNDRLASFSNFGKKTVHIAAPGVKILSTILGHKYGELSGTSMASPHVAGLAAVVASKYPQLSYFAVKSLVLTGGQKIEAAANTTVSGRRLRGADENGVGSLTCSNQLLSVRKDPVAQTHRVPINQALFLSALHLNCEKVAGPLTVYENDGTTIILTDDGVNGDAVAHDGIYSLNWTPTKSGTYELRFSETDIVTVTVYDEDNLDPYIANDQIPFDYLTIGGQRLRAGDDTMHQVKAPFPILFGGDSNRFTDLYISSNGTISFTNRGQPGFLNRRLPTAVAHTLISPYWDDLATISGNSDIYVETLGSEPNRQFVVEWWRVKNYQASGLGAFQVVFYENSSDFRFNYYDTNFSDHTVNEGLSATVGVQTDQTNALEVSFNKQQIPSQKSIVFSLQ